VIESSDLMTQQKTPGLGQAALQIGDAHVRNRVTIGGILIHSDPRADYPGVVLALEATIVTQESAGERTIDPFVFLPGFG
jgi:carbon-monoxide dehydrogenase medium subunit